MLSKGALYNDNIRRHRSKRKMFMSACRYQIISDLYVSLQISNHIWCLCQLADIKWYLMFMSACRYKMISDVYGNLQISNDIWCLCQLADIKWYLHAFFYFFSHMFSHSIFIGRSADWYFILWENGFRSVVSALNQMHVHSRKRLSGGYFYFVPSP